MVLEESMKELIKIAERFIPFTHVPGTIFLIPDSFKKVQIFPAALHFIEEDKLIELPVEGPVKNFSAFYDLEKQRLQVIGSASNGYFSYFLKGDQLYLEKGSEKFLNRGFIKEALLKKEELERISFGVTKKSEWDQVLKRLSLSEILPYIFLQGQQLPELSYKLTHSIAKDLEKAIEERETNQIAPLFSALIQTGFRGVLVPEQKDSHYLGFSKPPISESCSSLIIPKIIYHSIRKLILTEELEILPLIGRLFPSGRALHLKTAFGKIDLEWSKGKLRKMMIYSEKEQEIFLKFRKEYKKVRLNKEDQNIVNQSVKLSLQPNQFYFLDRFC